MEISCFSLPISNVNWIGGRVWIYVISVWYFEKTSDEILSHFLGIIHTFHLFFFCFSWGKNIPWECLHGIINGRLLLFVRTKYRETRSSTIKNIIITLIEVIMNSLLTQKIAWIPETQQYTVSSVINSAFSGSQKFIIIDWERRLDKNFSHHTNEVI